MVLPCNSMLVLADFFFQSLLIGEGEMVQTSKRSQEQHHSDMNAGGRRRGREILPNSFFHLGTLNSPPSPPLFFFFVIIFILLFVLPLHQLVARATRLVVFYCVLRGPVHRYGPDQTAAADLEEIYEVSDAAVAVEREREGHESEEQLIHHFTVVQLQHMLAMAPLLLTFGNRFDWDFLQGE